MVEIDANSLIEFVIIESSTELCYPLPIPEDVDLNAKALPCALRNIIAKWPALEPNNVRAVVRTISFVSKSELIR